MILNNNLMMNDSANDPLPIDDVCDSHAPKAERHDLVCTGYGKIRIACQQEWELMTFGETPVTLSRIGADPNNHRVLRDDFLKVPGK